MKRVILLLIVVLILFGIMMACGLTLDHSGSRASDEPGWMSLLRPFTQKSPVAQSDILPTQCFAQGDLIAKPNLPCAIQIRTSDASGSRTMKLVMVSGRSSKIDVQTHGKAGMQVEVPLHSETPKSPELQVPKEGAEIKILCAEPGPDAATAGGPQGAQVPVCRLRMSK